MECISTRNSLAVSLRTLYAPPFILIDPVGKKTFTNEGGFHFILTQVDFFENGQNYLGLTTVTSPDAGKWSFQATSGASQFGYVASLSPKQGQGTIVTTAGSKGILDLTILHSSLPKPL